MIRPLSTQILVIPDNSDEKEQVSVGGIIIPSVAQRKSGSEIKTGIVAAKSQNPPPWCPMEDIHVRHRVYWRKGAGVPYTDSETGAEYLILDYSELTGND